jgi:hypothetical protein
MIKENLLTEYPHQLNGSNVYNDHIYIADYTEQTKKDTIKRDVEISSPQAPSDINYCTVLNKNKLDTRSIIFDSRSFTYSDGRTRSQCECVLFPEQSDDKSWILFVELKYSQKTKNNRKNLQKAIKQLYKTRTYYARKEIFSKNNTCYLLASLPLQPVPFRNFEISQSKLQQLKSKHNVVLRLQNSARIINNEMIFL